MAKILDSKNLSEVLVLKLERKVRGLKAKPKLVIIQIGNQRESNTYIRNKKIFAEKIGVLVEHRKYPDKVKELQVIADITKDNINSKVHGIMVQLPAPKQFNIEKVLEFIHPQKDVDGLTAINTKHLFDNNEVFIPATAKGILTLLEEYKIKLAGAKITVVGQSSLVGKPVMLTLLNRGATVTVCHKDTKNLEKETREADVLITAAGQPKLITKKHVSRGQIVIDVGTNIMGNKKVVGDVDFEKVKKIVRAVSPVPGGVGPMTVVSLFQNLLKAYSLQT